MAKRKVVNYIIIIGVIVLFVAIIFIPPTIKVNELKQEVQKQEEVINKSLRKNETLYKEKKLLEENPEYIEEVARGELGLIKKDEVIYRRELEENKNNKD